MYRLYRVAIACLAAIVVLIPAGAQSAVNVDLNTRSFVWTPGAVDATHPAPLSYNMKCGTTTGVYTIIVAVNPVTGQTTPPTQVPLNAVLTSPGVYFCAVTAVNQFGESLPSNEVNLNAGYGSAAPTGLGTK